jgi:ABC-type amino acid transport substrate-binding protein
MSIQKLLSVAVAACALLITACGEKKKSDGHTIVVGTSPDYAPYEFFKDGEMTGFDIELMREVGRRLGKEVDFRDLSFDAIIGSLKSERIDAAISSITPIVERLKSVDFSDEYTESRNTVMLCRGTSTITTIEDLVNETIGVQSGSIHESYARNTLNKDVTLTVKSLAKIPDLIQDMSAGRVSCLVLGPEEAREIVKSHSNLKIVDLPDTIPGFAIALPKGSSLTQAINKVLGEMKADGFLDKLKKKWLT